MLVVLNDDAVCLHDRTTERASDQAIDSWGKKTRLYFIIKISETAMTEMNISKLSKILYILILGNGRLHASISNFNWQNKTRSVQIFGAYSCSKHDVSDKKNINSTQATANVISKKIEKPM